MSKKPASADPLGAPSPSSAKSAKLGLDVPSDSAMQVNEASLPYLAQAGAQDVPPGYKRTEVGVIPEDWNTPKLGSLGGFFKGQGVKRAESDTGNIPCVRYGEIYTHHDEIVRRFVSHISWKVADTATPLRTGDILFAGSGETKTEIGKAVAFIGEHEAYAGGDIVILRQQSADPRYLGYVLNAPVAICQKSSKGQGDAVVHISASALASVKIPLPPSDEQSAIATALSDADALIESLDRLIAKRRAIKQAAMQQLLTGQTRLPGFTGEWETKRLGDVAEIRSGGTPSTTTPSHWGGGIAWCTPTDITALDGRKYLSGTARTISDSGLATSSAEIIPRNSVIMTSRATIGECAINTAPMTTNQGFKNLVPMACNTEFLYYLMSTQKERLIQLCAGSTFLEVGAKQLKIFEVNLPKDTAEQEAIATVLSDMDTEIEALEHRRGKARQIKQGMMQQLLTGRVRLVTPEVAA